MFTQLVNDSRISYKKLAKTYLQEGKSLFVTENMKWEQMGGGKICTSKLSYSYKAVFRQRICSHLNGYEEKFISSRLKMNQHHFSGKCISV